MDIEAAAKDLLRTHFFRTMSVYEIEKDEFYDLYHGYIENFLKEANIKYEEYEIGDVALEIYSQLNDYTFFPTIL
jgi:hypothetical protein